ncbi:MAG TPA: 2-oxoglutarate dehydrogenase E1 component [Chloroflexota bacterium]|jgi:2-oxoglutarate dehydrogenase E1 component|nr:2-oxoglutarate dehydrogenase E1 component [Chloroflexota bacterium]
MPAHDLAAFTGPNAAYVLDLYDQYVRDPSSLDQATRDFFAAWQQAPLASNDGAPAMNGKVTASADPTSAAPVNTPELLARDRIVPEEAVRLAMGVTALARAIRDYGHLAAHTDPLETPPPGDPDLDPSAYHILEEELITLSPEVVQSKAAPKAVNALDVIQRLRELYCGTTGYDFTHVQSADERAWLIDAIESQRFRTHMRSDEQRALLVRLTAVETFERYLQDSHRGMTRFSIEGVDLMVPMLDEIIGCAVDAGTHDVLLGMAHRGRLNVLAHVLGRPYAAILAEFQASQHGDSPLFTVRHYSGWTGDVKYHAGARRVFGGNDVVQMSVRLAPNPSHLEFVNPIVEGRTRAAQETREQPGPPRQDEQRALPILVHGDAAFPGEGIVAETLNLSRLAGYRTGGTIHIIANNQIGFTTEPKQGRSTLYASDLAKGFEIPIVHVNADDPEACLAAARMAYAYRLQFRKDVLIDLIGYRRLGHNEGDEPSFTQPEMYVRITSHPTVRQLWEERLVAAGVVTREDAGALISACRKTLETAASAREPVDAGLEETQVEEPQGDVTTAVPAARLRELNSALFNLPAGFTTRVGRILERRRDALQSDGPIDWGHAELLAMASILADGVPIRLTGQDTERGTFGHRHAVVHDAATGAAFTPLQHLPQAKASFAVYNSPLSEAAVLGFEYGYSIQAPRVLVLWEAQYGDFINAAQVIVDEFVMSGYAKWRQTPSLVLLLPHGYEGGGPDHSSARIERFLRQSANQNIRVANCTTAAQYFHLLRRQAALLEQAPRPLVVFTPKSLLRHPRATSSLSELARGSFQPVLDDAQAQSRAAEVTRVLLCSGKVFVDLDTSPARGGNRAIAIVRLEELYPVPEQRLRDVLAHYPACQELFWVQEEPSNMGAWPFLAPAIRAIAGPAISVRYVGRPDQGSPAEGSPEVHMAEQSRLVAEAFAAVPALTQREREVAHAR